jgi:hypothetical protein
MFVGEDANTVERFCKCHATVREVIEAEVLKVKQAS